MRLVLFLLTFFFIFSAVNDCCLSEVQEELSKISKTSNSEKDHSEDSEACEDCQCSSFCAYNLVVHNPGSSIIGQLSFSLPLVYFLKVAEITNIPDPIFHPPIA